MDIDWDLLNDCPPVPVGGNAKKPLSRFAPKGKALDRKETHATLPCNPTSSVKELHTLTIRPCSTVKEKTLPEPHETKQPTNNAQILNLGRLQLDNSIGSADLVFPQAVTTRNNVCTRELPDTANYIAEDTADIFSGLEPFGDADVLSTAQTLQFDVNLSARLRDKLRTLRPITTDPNGSVSHSEAPILPPHDTDLKGRPDVHPEPIVPQDRLISKETAVCDDTSSVDVDIGRNEKEESDGYPAFGTSDLGDSEIYEADYVDPLLDFSNTRLSDSTPVEISVNEGSHIADVPNVDAATLEAVHSQDLTAISGRGASQKNKRKRKTSTKNLHVEDVAAKGDNDEHIEEVISHSKRESKKSRKPVAENEKNVRRRKNTSKDPDFESSDATNADDDEYREEETSLNKRPSKKTNKSAVEIEKTDRRHKNVSKDPDAINNAPPKKKFSCSTRRNKRTVDKALLEIPEDELDVRTLRLKDLIRLADARERLQGKDVATSSNSVPDQSFGKSFEEEDPYPEYDHYWGHPEDDLYASPRSPYSEHTEATNKTEEVPPTNYGSFRTKTSKARWTKQDTELFYEAIRQFGTDFEMIRTLFDGRTRNHIKSKYKKEEREHPLELSDALDNRSKNLSYFERVLKKVSEDAGVEEQSSLVDEEAPDLAGQEEGACPETNEKGSQPEHQAKEASGEVEQGGKILESEGHPENQSDQLNPQEEEDVPEEFEFDFSQYTSAYDDDED